ncbi:hypothetical protein Godav_023597, partial [Gossypium davidsonii]|nr:hypothetical protein [Gossypium davidsonii]
MGRVIILRVTTSTPYRIYTVAHLEERNKRVHEKTSRSGKEIAFFIKRYISKLSGIEEKVPKVITGDRKWKHPPGQFVKVNFDAAYD